ncbi:response regulator [Geobacillus thermoleovorans]|uniref:response regulator transcription factor n=1 Tax=Geobacillus thermoleovorans TaxID=33941 RepID=UPI00345BAAD5
MSYKVLLVDDEPLIVKSLANTINWKQLDCTIAATAENGKKALEAVKELHIDLVLTDIRMPVMNGIDFLKALSENFYNPKVILLSGYDEFKYAREGLRYNAFDYILKPIDYYQLEECIARAVEELGADQKQKYECMKNRIYDQLMLNNVKDAVLENYSFQLIIAQVKKDASDKIAPFYDWVEQQGCRYEQVNVFIYKFDQNELIIILTAMKEKEEQMRNATDVFVQTVLSFFEQKCVIAVAPLVTGVSNIQCSFVQARELLRMGLALRVTVVTEDIVGENKIKNTASSAIEKAIQFLDENYHQDIGIDQVAERVGLSPSYFSVLFKQKMGVTFLEYLTNIRIKNACLLLKMSHMKTYEIAEKVGYTDQRYFSQVFKRKLNMTPGEYRKIHSRE